MIIATAGHDTTSASTAGGLLELIRNPDQMAALRNDVEGLMPTAIDEMIRWVSPVRHFMLRTATADTEIAGQKIKAGESMIFGGIRQRIETRRYTPTPMLFALIEKKANRSPSVSVPRMPRSAFGAHGDEFAVP